MAGLRFRLGGLLDWDDSKSWFLTDCVGSVWSDSEIRVVLDVGFDDVGKGVGV